MSERSRRLVFVVSALGFGALLLWGMAGLPDFGLHESAYARLLDSTTVARRHVTDVVTATVFDYRGIDTLGEEFLLFTAAVGAILLLREQRGEVDRPPDDEGLGRVAVPMSPAVRFVGVALIGPVVVVGTSLVAHGHLSPGGGFQGGVALAATPFLAYLIGEFRALDRSTPWPLVETSEALGAAGYVALGILGLVAGVAYLENVLPLGSAGSLASGGTILALDVAAGLAVCGAVVVLLREFLHQTLIVRRQSADGRPAR